jgi:hypothetical protein
MVERPLNYYRNQVIFKESHIETIAQETVFPNIRRVTILQPSFTAENITEHLQNFHDGKQTAILAPENLIQIIQEVHRDNFSQKGHFVLCTFVVEDVRTEERQNALIAKEHERAHRGISEVEAQLKRAYFFPKMKKKITMFVNTCRTCNIHKYDRKPYNIKISPRPLTEKPFDRIHMDIFIMSKQNFLSLVDSFSKHLQMIPIKTKNVTDVTKALTKYFSTFGCPRLIVTDHETTFKSVQLRQFLDNLGIQIEYASSSESNGQVEKTHATMIEIYNTNKDKLSHTANPKNVVRASVALYNATVHSSTKFTPNEIIFNSSDADNPVDIQQQAIDIIGKVKEHLRRPVEKQEELNENRENPPQIQENEEVFLKPNIRTKTQPRGNPAEAKQIQEKTFFINNDIKRNKNKIKRKKNYSSNH